MLQVVVCTQCGESGHFTMEFSYVLEPKPCGVCHRFDEHRWRYHFCNQACFVKWFKGNNIGTEGVPCRACMNSEGVSTGYEAGFKENGRCTICKGKKRMK